MTVNASTPWDDSTQDAASDLTEAGEQLVAAVADNPVLAQSARAIVGYTPPRVTLSALLTARPELAGVGIAPRHVLITGAA